MNPNCRKCGEPALYGRNLCFECAASEYLDEDMEGESWNDFLDDSVWDEEREHQNPEDYWDEDFDDE